MISAFGVDHGVLSKASHDPSTDEQYWHNDQTPRQRLAVAQQADWSNHRYGHAWVDHKLTRPTLRAQSSVRTELNRRRNSTSAKVLGSYHNRRVRINSGSEMGRGRSMFISDYRPVHTRKRALAAGAALAAGGGSAVLLHHRHQGDGA